MDNYTKTLLETVRQLQEENQAIVENITEEDDGYLELTEEEMEVLNDMGVLDILIANDMVETKGVYKKSGSSGREVYQNPSAREKREMEKSRKKGS